ncbi:lysozyme [Flavobacterium soyangense]|uniref:Lysozyme n=1 Tax=Flavobacterium soyangense TaxID=2023265 RepID=A0A930UCH3_9FLAO|nr:lysozyme [Flavobacterium soyangense]MBF2708776.1 lysozyme [Flavobacterium soyangense]
MKLNQAGYQLIQEFEGLKLKPYLCSAGVPTIGYGNTVYPNGRKVTMKDAPINKAFADQMFRSTADLFAKDVASLIKSKVNQNQFNTLVSLAYNVGTDIDADDIPEGLGDSTLLKKVNVNPNDKTIENEFLKWNKANGKINTGLTNRRKKESIIYSTPIK